MVTASNQLVYPGDTGFPREQWYVAAFSSELDDGPLAREILGTPVVLYRTADGAPVALYDRCPHRGLPLSMGACVEGRLRCGYHGMEFGPDGACTRIPSQDFVPRVMSVQSYPLVQKWNWLWIWMGDPAKADPALVPDHKWLGIESEGYHPVEFAKMEMQANYMYMHDNLLDTSHLTFLHPALLDAGEMAESKFHTEEEGQILKLVRETPNLIFPAQVAWYFRVDEGRPYDRVLSTETFVPSVSIARQSIRDPENPSAQPIELSAINALTPANARKTHVFHVQVTSYDANWQAADFDNVRNVLVQDQVAVEAMQERFDRYQDRTEVSVRSDQSGVQCRRIIQRLLQQEGVAHAAE